MSEFDKEIEYLRDRSEGLLRWIEANQEVIIPRCNVYVGESLQEGDSSFDGRALFVAASRRVQQGMEELIEAVQAHLGELGHDDHWRLKRDAALVSVRNKVRSLKLSIEASHGADGLRILGLQGRIPQRPGAIVDYVTNLQQKLVEAPATSKSQAPAFKVLKLPFLFELGSEEEASFPRWTAARVYTSLENAIKPLKAALDGLGIDQKETDAALVGKWQKIEQQTSVLSHYAALLETLALMADEPQRAERLAMTQKIMRTASGRASSSDGETSPSTPAPGAGVQTGSETGNATEAPIS